MSGHGFAAAVAIESQPVGDDDDSAPRQHRVQGPLGRARRARVEQTGGLVEDEGGRVHEDDARQGHLLGLAGIQDDPARAHERAQAVGQPILLELVPFVSFSRVLLSSEVVLKVQFKESR